MKNFGETLKKIRKQKDMTQEQLAEYLNISPQSVSKWETNLTLPDITLIPMLANIFEVSADTILGIDIDIKKKRIQDIIEKADEYVYNGYNVNEATETLREGLKEYPNSYKLMSKLMECIWRRAYQLDDEDKIAYLKESIKLGEKILSECTDDECRHKAIQVLCHIYPDPQIGECEKAVKLANKMPNSSLSRESLLVQIYKGTEKFEQKRSKFYFEINTFLWGLYPYDDIFDDGSKPHTPEECIVLCHKMIKILNLIFDDGNYLENRFFLSSAYYCIAENYAVLGDYENSMTNLNLAAEQVILCDEETVSGYGHLESVIPPFKGMPLYVRPVRPEKMYVNNLLEKMADITAFDPIRESKSFIEVEEKLNKYAKNK